MYKLFKTVRKIEKFLIITTSILLVITAFLQVFSRSVLKNPITWTEEASRYLFIWNVFFSSVVVMSMEDHFKVDFIYEKLNNKMKSIVYIFSMIIIFIFSLLILYYGIEIFLKASNRVTPSLGIPMSYIYIPNPIFGLLSIFHLFEKVFKYFYSNRGEI